VPRQHPLYIPDLGPRKRVCLVFDPPPPITTPFLDGEAAAVVIQPPPFTGFFSVRHQRARVSCTDLEPIADVVPTVLIPQVVDTTPEDYFAIPPMVAVLPVVQAQGDSGGENLVLDSTKDDLSCVAVGHWESCACHTSVLKTVITAGEPQHLAALWKRRQTAHAGSTPSVTRDYTRNSCEFIHCQCAICVSFKNSAGAWCSAPCRTCVGCKCVRCWPCFNATGHWDAAIARQRGPVGQFHALPVLSPVSP